MCFADAVNDVAKARCSISNGVLHEYGRNAQPVGDGLCCTQCNHAHVIPARLARLQAFPPKPQRSVMPRGLRGCEAGFISGPVLDLQRPPTNSRAETGDDQNAYAVPGRHMHPPIVLAGQGVCAVAKAPASSPAVAPENLRAAYNAGLQPTPRHGVVWHIILTARRIFASTAVICLLGVRAMAADGLTTIASSFGPKETMDRLETEIKARGMTVFSRIDHAAGAAEVGLPLRPNELLIFGNAKAGTPLMQADQAIGIDLPLKALVFEDSREGLAILR